MKHKKIISTLLFAAAGALLVGFAVKTAADYAEYSHSVTGAPFTLWVSVNALCFITPAAVIAGAALCIRRRTRALIAVTLAFATLTILTIIFSRIVRNHALADSLIYGIPFALPALINGILIAVSHGKRLEE